MEIVSNVFLATSVFSPRFALVLIVGAIAWGTYRTSLVGCTVLGVVLAGAYASFCQDEQHAMFAILLGLTVGPFVGVVVDVLRSRDRRIECFIGRRYGRDYVCPDCDHRFESIQKVGQCPACNSRFDV